MNSERELDLLIEALLADPQYLDHPLREALFLKHQQSLDQLARLERIARISDGFQSMARAQNSTLSERYHKQLRQLEKVARISDRYQDMMRDLNVALREASTHDPLTGIGNRRLLMERLREESERAQRHGKPYVLVILDIDHFKQVNDTYGHPAGDAVIRAFADVLLGLSQGEPHLVARVGGEEFAILLRGAGTAEAMVRTAEIQEALASRALPVSETFELRITASYGIATRQPAEPLADLFARADQALYRAKSEGRNRIGIAAVDAVADAA